MTWGQGDYHELPEWKLASGVAEVLRSTCANLELSQDRNWVREIILDAADNLTDALAEGQQSEYVAEYLLGVGSARNSIVVAEYCVRFLRGEGLLHPEQADYVDERLDDLESALAALSGVLRENLPNERRRPNN